MDDLTKKLHKMIDNHGRGSAVYADDYLSLAEIDAILTALGDAQEDLGEADVWHEGSQSFYHARLLRKLTPEEALALPPEIEGDDEVRKTPGVGDTPRTDRIVTGNSDPSTEEYEDLATFTRQLERETVHFRQQVEHYRDKCERLAEASFQSEERAVKAERELADAADLLGKGPNLLISRAHYQELINRLSEKDRNLMNDARGRVHEYGQPYIPKKRAEIGQKIPEDKENCPGIIG